MTHRPDQARSEDPPLTDDVLRWALARTSATQVVGWRSETLDGGAVSGWVERLTIELTRADGRSCDVAVVRKRALPHEAAGLDAAQVVREQTAIVPELVAAGTDGSHWWVVTPFHPGTALATPPAPDEIIEGLALLHAHFHDRPVPYLPVVDAQWWLDLVSGWVRPEIEAQPRRHPDWVHQRIERTLDAVVSHSAALDILAQLPTTLLHGDVHPGNILIGAGLPQLIDWGSARTGPAMLDLASITAPGTRQLALYRDVRQKCTGTAPGDTEILLGFTWAALQLPVQYLPWTVGHASTPDTITALEQIDNALSACDRR